MLSISKFTEKNADKVSLEKMKITNYKYNARMAKESLTEIIKIYWSLNDNRNKNSMANELGLKSGFFDGKTYSNQDFLSWQIHSNISDFTIKEEQKTLTNTKLYKMAQTELQILLRAIMNLLFVYPCGNSKMARKLGIYMTDPKGGNKAMFSWSCLSILHNQGLIEIYDKDNNKMLFSERNGRHMMMFKISENVDINNYVIKKQKSIKKTNKSYGENTIHDILKKKNIAFTSEKTFSGLKGIGNGNLRFDFCCTINNQIYLIEYDGKQHFEPVEIWGGQLTLERRQKHDKIKNDYCEKNNIKLLRISYEEKTRIKTHIIEFINNHHCGITYKGSKYII
jgi:hypothetical protein